jgi:endonuclease G, mitochondrial
MKFFLSTFSAFILFSKFTVCLSQSAYTPFLTDSAAYIDHSCFELEYSETHEQAKWTYHLLTREMTRANTERSDRFLVDSKVKTNSATDADYKGSGYDRGHIVPAADMAFSEECMNTSFYYSNMSPQVPSFNRGIWKKLETLVRYWAFAYDSIHIVSGPILQDSLPSIGPNQVAIPEYYFKALLVYQKNDKRAIGFILPNASSSQNLEAFAISIDEIERKTGLNFFHSLDDRIENELESTISLDQWVWKAETIVHPPQEPLEIAVQCTGKSKSNKRCKRKTTDPSKKCYQHKL